MLYHDVIRQVQAQNNKTVKEVKALLIEILTDIGIFDTAYKFHEDVPPTKTQGKVWFETPYGDIGLYLTRGSIGDLNYIAPYEYLEMFADCLTLKTHSLYFEDGNLNFARSKNGYGGLIWTIYLAKFPPTDTDENQDDDVDDDTL